MEIVKRRSFLAAATAALPIQSAQACSLYLFDPLRSQVGNHDLIRSADEEDVL